MTPDKTNTHPEALDLDAAAKFAKYWQEATRFPSEVTRHIEELVAECRRLRAALRAPLTATAPGPGMIADVSRHDWGDTIVFRKGSKDVAIVECTHEEAEEICGKFAQPPAPAPGEAE